MVRVNRIIAMIIEQENKLWQIMLDDENYGSKQKTNEELNDFTCFIIELRYSLETFVKNNIEINRDIIKGFILINWSGGITNFKSHKLENFISNILIIEQITYNLFHRKEGCSGTSEQKIVD